MHLNNFFSWSFDVSAYTNHLLTYSLFFSVRVLSLWVNQLCVVVIYKDKRYAQPAVLEAQVQDRPRLWPLERLEHKADRISCRLVQKAARHRPGSMSRPSDLRISPIPA